MLTNQKSIFDLDPSIHYMNGAAYSPLPKDSIEAGVEALLRKGTKPFVFSKYHHFDAPDKLRAQFAQLINGTDAGRVAIIPAVSYGIATVAKNLHRIKDKSKTEIILIADDFPNNYLTFKKVADELNWSIKTIETPSDNEKDLGLAWNEALLAAISPKTACVIGAFVHWTKGVLFDVERIGAACKAADALFVVDGSQGIGVVPFDVVKCHCDALITTGYKWTMGTYGVCLAYYGDFFDDGDPIEESWMNRLHSDNFAKLTDYQDEYRPLAQRYNQGEFSNFVGVAVFENSLRQINAWGVENIQAYIQNLTAAPITELERLGFGLLAPSHRAPHLLSITLPAHIDAEQLALALKKERIYISLRGAGIRVSTHIYTTKADWEKLITVLKEHC